MRKLYLFRYLLYLDLLDSVGFVWNCLEREFFLLQDTKRPFENQGLEERPNSGYTGLSGNDL